MANKKYVNDSMQNSTFQVNSHKPMDDRLVIRLRENLMQSETWQLTSNGDVMLYSGIVVNVIDDTDANNGLYSLKNWTKYDKQSWDETDDLTYDADGWKKVSAADKQEVYWCYWDDNNSTVTGLTPTQIYQLTQDGCIVKCKFVDGADETIYDLDVVLHDDEYVDYYEIAFINNTIRPNSVSADRILYTTSSGWTIDYFQYQPPTNYEETTYSQLYSKVNSGTLEKGKYYRITDYVTTTSQYDTQSANHPFDLLVFATSESTLDCHAKAMIHEGDTYFLSDHFSRNLSKWQIWYDIHNDRNKYRWAANNGKGVIYRMIDDYGNDCAYDFKNIQFTRKILNGQLDTNGIDTWVYTFNAWNRDDETIEDASCLNSEDDLDNEFNHCKNNIIGGHILDADADHYLYLNNIVFLNIYSNEDTEMFSCILNHLKERVYEMTFGNNCNSNKLGSNSWYNTFGHNCDSNIFGESCQRNNFGNIFAYNSIGNFFMDNTFGERCSKNNFSDQCAFNQFGNYCSENTFGVYCRSITMGNSCCNNSFKNNCVQIVFGNGSGLYGDNIRNVVVQGYNAKIRIYNSGISDSNHCLQNIYIAQGVSNYNQSSPYLDISTIARALNYRTTVARLSDGTIRIYKEDEDDMNVQPDWNQTDTTADDYIKNKPTIPSAVILRTMNHEQLTDSSLGDINIHDGYYFPNAVQDYDGNWYGAVIIGDQVWMAENLKTTHYSDGTSIPDGSNATNVVGNPQPYYYHVNNDASLDDEYGLLYNWMAVMNGASETNANPSGVQGVAPVGWHIPSGSEVDTLTQYVSNQKRFIADNITSNIAKSLAYHSLWNSSSDSITPGTNQNDNNKTGFAAKPAGSGYIDMSLSTPVSFDLLGADFRMWTTNYVEFVIQYNDSTVNKWTNSSLKYFGHSVRCVSDLSPVQFRNWYVDTYGTMQHHLNENIIVNQNYDLYRCVMSYDAWINVMGSGEYPTGTYLTEFTFPTNNPYIILNHVDKPSSNPIIISKFNATNGQYESLLPQQQSFVGLNHLITDAATDDHGAYQFELLPDMVNPVYHVFDIQHGLYAVWHKNGDAAMGNASTVYQGILIGVTTSIGNDTEEIAFMIKIYKNSIQQ